MYDWPNVGGIIKTLYSNIASQIEQQTESLSIICTINCLAYKMSESSENVQGSKVTSSNCLFLTYQNLRVFNLP